jgi:hypothetical protein
MEQRRYWSPADIEPIRLSSNQAYADGLRECLDRAVRRQMRSAHPIGCYLSGGLDSSSVAALAARALGERDQRLAAFTQVPREGFDGSVPTGRYADETPYVEAIRKAAGNIDVTYVRNNDCDDFAELERFFLALEGPVRNPTNLGWMLAIPRLARAQGRRVLLGGLCGNYTISRKRSSTCCADGCSRPAGSGDRFIAARPTPAGPPSASSSSSRWFRKSWRAGPIAGAAHIASLPGRITRRSNPISPQPWELTPAPSMSATISSTGCGPASGWRGSRRSIMAATGSRPRRRLPE